MDESVKSYYDPTYKDMQSIEEYENSHKVRIQHLIDDLRLNELTGKFIIDVGCGSALFFRMMPEDKDNLMLGIDGADVCDFIAKVNGKRKEVNLRPIGFFRQDLNCDFYNEVLNSFLNAGLEKEDLKADLTVCFETLEHVENPYGLIKGIKNLTKEDGDVIISIPAEDCMHNTLYPSLLWPRQNFIQFLRQMAMEVVEVRRHDKAFSQDVYILKNKNWNFSEMKFYRKEAKFRGVEPLVSVNM